MYRLSREAMAIIVASIVIFRCIILFRISHFGMNPVIGGSPPVDKMVADRSSIRAGEEVHTVPMSFIVVDDVMFMTRKMGVVVIT